MNIVIAGATSFRGHDPHVANREVIEAAGARPYAEHRAEHIADYARLHGRVAIDLGGPDLSNIPTDERVERVKGGAEDPQLEGQYFQFGWYLLIASSRPGGLPANLQGVWAEGMDPPWQSDFHLNINPQMNYWPAEPTNLAECHLPLFDLLDSLREPGRETAKVHYGAGGFVAHHITDIWGFTVAADAARWGLWPMGAAWTCLHLGTLRFLTGHGVPRRDGLPDHPRGVRVLLGLPRRGARRHARDRPLHVAGELLHDQGRRDRCHVHGAVHGHADRARSVRALHRGVGDLVAR